MKKSNGNISHELGSALGGTCNCNSVVKDSDLRQLTDGAHVSPKYVKQARYATWAHL